MERSVGKRIVGMIPARIGSTRLKMKNLALINGKPMIAYVIEAAKKSNVFDRIVVNSDSPILGKIADQYDVEFYQRPESLGSSITKSDDVVLDFIDKHPCKIIAWVNPISPLQPSSEIKDVVEYFLNNGLDSLITVKNEQVHAIFNDNPINFSIKGKFAQTQDLTPVQPFVYSIMMWRTETFVTAMKEQGYAFFSGKVGFFPVSKESSIIIKTAEDLRLADYIQRSKMSESEDIRYSSLVANN